METRTLHAADILPPGDAFHFTRAVLSKRQPRVLHDHDYYELFWLHNGRARHFLKSGKSVLSEGDLVFVRPQDAHALQGVGEEPHLVNIIIRPETVERLAKRHQFGPRFFWGDAPFVVHRDIRQLSDLSHAAVALESGPRSDLAIEAFVMTLLASLVRDYPELPADVPSWLADALSQAQQPRVFRDGSAGLVRLTGRSHAHVARSVQKYLGQTPSEYVNGLRVAYAAQKLAGTGDRLTEIAEEVGITNMSHFHKLFLAKHGVTPRQYRAKHQKGVVQPF